MSDTELTAAETEETDAPTTPAAAALRFLKAHAEIVVIVVLLLATRLLRSPTVPGAIYMLGIAGGAILALQAIGIVLVYRANRIINFAQVELGALGGVLFLELVRGRLLLKGLRAVCLPCLPGPETVADLATLNDPSIQALTQQPRFAAQPTTRLADLPDLTRALPPNVTLDDIAAQSASGWLVQLNFWVSLILSIGVVVLLSYAVYALVIRRFESAPRLIATVLTIGLGQVFVFLGSLLVQVVRGAANEQQLQLLRADASFPFDWTITIGAVRFGTSAVIGVVVAVIALAGLALFFARSSMGIVLRGASENADRARSLGVNIGSVNAVVWMLAGLLSAIAAILTATATGVGTGGGAGLVKYLAAAVVGGMVSIPLAAIAAVTISVLEQSVLWSLKAPAVIDAAILGMVVVVLLVQRSRATRSDTEAEGGWKAAREMRPIPDELKDLEVVKKWRRTGIVLLAAVVLSVPWLFSPSQTNLASVTLIYSVIALSLLVLMGWAGQISLGHFAFAAIGAWVTAVLDWPFPLSGIAGGLVGCVVAVAIGFPALRLRGLHLAVSTLAFAVAATSFLLGDRYLGKHVPDALDRPAVIGLDLGDQRTFYYFTLVSVLVALGAVIGLRRSRAARALIACRENEAAAQAFGINLLRARLSAFAVSGFMASFAGGLYAYSQYGVDAPSYGFDQSIKMFLMVVIGGTGSIAGPLIGAAFVGAVDIFGRSIPLLSLGATGIGVVGLLLLAPGGLGEVAYRMRDSVLRRIADRYRIDVPSLIADRKAASKRARIAAKTRPGGGTVFVPRRYRAEGQWSVEARRREATRV